MLHEKTVSDLWKSIERPLQSSVFVSYIPDPNLDFTRPHTNIYMPPRLELRDSEIPGLLVLCVLLMVPTLMSTLTTAKFRRAPRSHGSSEPPTLPYVIPGIGN